MVCATLSLPFFLCLVSCRLWITFVCLFWELGSSYHSQEKRNSHTVLHRWVSWVQCRCQSLSHIVLKPGCTSVFHCLSISMTLIMCRCRLSAFVSPAVFPTRDPMLLSSATETKETHVNIHTLIYFQLSLAIQMSNSQMLVKTCFNLIALLLPAFCSRSPTLSIFLCYSFCLVLQDGGVAALFFIYFLSVMSSQLRCYWSHFLSSLLSHFICHPPSLLSFSLLSPHSLAATFPQPQPLPFTFCPLPSPSLLSMFSFFLQLHWYHPAVLSSPFPSFDHPSLHHCSLLILLSLSTSPPVFLWLFLPPS